jgi:ABC-type transporter MlaC component
MLVRDDAGAVAGISRTVPGLRRAAYHARLSQFGGTLFGVTGTQRNGDEIVVTSEAVRAEDPPVRIDWYLINRAGRYKIADVSVDGVSMKGRSATHLRR